MSNKKTVRAKQKLLLAKESLQSLQSTTAVDAAPNNAETNSGPGCTTHMAPAPHGHPA